MIMEKWREMDMVDSCWNKANLHEIVFIMLERDPTMPAVLRAWIEERIKLGLNKREDAKIRSAEDLIVAVERRNAT